MPFPSCADNVIEASKQLLPALQNPAPSAPFSQFGYSTMESIKQLSVILRRQTDAIQAAVTSPAISKPPQPKEITTIPNSPHPTPHIIENYDGYISHVHRVIAHQSKLWPHIIPPETPQPRIVENYLHIAYPRVPKIPQPTPVSLPRVPTARHQYNLRTK